MRRRTRIQLCLLCLTTTFVAPTLCSAGQPPQSITEKALAALAESHSQLDRSVLGNGTICLVKEDHSAPVVSIQIWVGTGSIHEHEYLGSGLSHAIEHMIFKGTDKRAPGEISREIDGAGGRVNAYTSFDRTVFHADLPARNWRVGLDVLADAVMHASFPHEEWDSEKQVILREIAMGKDASDRVLGKLLWRTAYAVHPYRFPIIGYDNLFAAVTRKDLVTFFRRNYVSDNMIIVIIGGVDADEVKQAVHGIFAGFQRRARPPVLLPVEPPQVAPRFARQTGAYRVSRLSQAYHTVPLHHPDTPTLDLLAEIVGHGRSSRLVRAIKENKQLVHSISAGSYTPKQPGLFSITAAFLPEKEAEAVAAIQEEIDSWLTEDFSQKEIDKARRMILSSELSDLQTMKGQANSFAAGEFYAGDPGFSLTYLTLLDKVTPARLKSVVQKYLVPQNRTLAVLSPATAQADHVSAQAKGTTIKADKLALSNGIPLIVREDHRLPFVYFCAAFRGGLLSENSANTGITRLMSDLLTRGTRTRTAQEIATTVESLGGALASFSGYNSFGLKSKCLSSDTETFMTILSDCLLNAAFPISEVEKQKHVQSATIDQQHERPFFLAQKQLRATLFPNHPYRWSTLGTKETVQAIARTDLEQYYTSHVTSHNMVLSIFGDITAPQAKELADRLLADIPETPAPQLHGNSESQPVLPARSLRHAPKQQSIFLAGFPGVDIKDPRGDALAVLRKAMTGLSADLNFAVREERGLAYYVGAYQQMGIEPGAFVVYAGTRKDAIIEVEQLILKEISRLVTDGLRQEEFARARDQIIASYEMGLQDNLNVAMECALNELYGLGYMHAFTTPVRFNRLTTDAVRTATASILQTNKLAISLIVPANNEEEQHD